MLACIVRVLATCFLRPGSEDGTICDVRRSHINGYLKEYDGSR